MYCHLCLVYTPIDKKYKDALTHFAPPLGLVALANFIRHLDKEVRISILDGSTIYSMESIIEFIEKEKPDFIGQSVQLISYENALIIAQYGHQLGAKNIFGGHHVTQMAEAIAVNQSHLVDYIVCGDGELPLWQIINRKPLEDIPNLVFVQNGVVHRTQPFILDLSISPLLDYSEIPLEPYKKLLNESSFDREKNDVKNYLRIYSHKGCGNRTNSDGCLFCGRADFNVRFKSPEMVWCEIVRVINVHDADYIFDVGDDFMYKIEWLKAVAKMKPKIDKNYRFGIFGRSNRITSESADLLKTIGITDVVIGFESGDEEVLRRVNKRNTTPETNILAARELFSHDIDVCASFVLGLPGENSHSIKSTIKAAKQIVDMSYQIAGKAPREMVANLLEPSPGSPIHKTLINAYPKKYIYNDKLTLASLQRDYFRYFFGLESYQEYIKFRRELSSAANEIHGYVGFSDSQGWFENEL